MSAQTRSGGLKAHFDFMVSDYLQYSNKNVVHSDSDSKTESKNGFKVKLLINEIRLKSFPLMLFF